MSDADKTRMIGLLYCANRCIGDDMKAAAR